MQAVVLACHPAAPCAYVRAVSVRADWVSEDLLSLAYRVEGDLNQLQLPARRPPAHADGLWQHTCFELFVQCGATPAYLELNFSPSGEWAIYGFADYRCGIEPREPRHPPEIVCRSSDGVLEADVTVRLDELLTERARGGGLRLGAAAVLEDRRGQLSYWALAHPAERPDFHRADSFTIALHPPGVAA
jgi:hypothetical protein